MILFSIIFFFFYLNKGIDSSSSAKIVLTELLDNGGNTGEIIKRFGLAQNSDDEYLCTLADEVIVNNPSSANDFKSGKTNALGHLIGQAMKLSKGKADPQKVKEIILNKLKMEE